MSHDLLDSCRGSSDHISLSREHDIVCQVDECDIVVSQSSDQKDLQNTAGGACRNQVKYYHARYRVCPEHQKALSVKVNGENVRFCQQCGKFQPLKDFQGKKKSCIERLEKHNARRRRLREIKHMLKVNGAIDKDVLRKKYGMLDQDISALVVKNKAKAYDRASSDSVLLQGTPSVSTSASEAENGPIVLSTRVDLQETTAADHVKYQDIICISKFAEAQDNEAALITPDNMPMDLEFILDNKDHAGSHSKSLSEHTDMKTQDEIENILTARDSCTMERMNTTDLCRELLLAPEGACYDFCCPFDEVLVETGCKLNQITPSELNTGVKPAMGYLCESDAVEGYMRSGCVYLQAFGVASPSSNSLKNVREKALEFLATTTNDDGSPLANSMVLQFDKKLVYVTDGKIKQVVCTERAGAALPSIDSVVPLGADAKSVESGLMRIRLLATGMQGTDKIFVRSQGKHLDSHVMSVEKIEGSDMQEIDLLILGDITPGCIHVEVNRFEYTSESHALLVTCTSEEMGEVALIESCLRKKTSKIGLYYMGVVMEAESHLDKGVSHKEIAQMFRDAPKTPEDCARELIPLTIVKKMPHFLSSCLESSLCCERSGREIINLIEESCLKVSGLTLLQLAVQSKSIELLQTIVDWAGSNDIPLRCSRPGKGNTTSLHLAVMVEDGGAMARCLTESCIDSVDGWEGSKADDGTSPLGLATQMGLQDEIEYIISRAAENSRLIPQHLKQSLNKRTWYRPEASVSNRHLAESDERTAVNQTNARDMNTFLEFSSMDLEERFKVWFNDSQSTLDVSFAAITAFSQASWIYKHSSTVPIYLTACMLVLLFFNITLASWCSFSPKTYIRSREKACVASFVLHLMMNALIHGGTGYVSLYSTSPSIFTTLFESSSLVQVIMLSFGARPRFKSYLFTLAAMLPISASMNKSICQSSSSQLSDIACVSGLLIYQIVFCILVPGFVVYKLEMGQRRTFLANAFKKAK